MQANRRADTTPEVQLRSALHRMGLRFRKDCRVDFGDASARPDIVFTRQEVAVFVDGCFWHGCPKHYSPPETHEEYWSKKLGRNRARDRRDTEALEEAGWVVLRFWECEVNADIARVTSRVAEELEG